MDADMLADDELHARQADALVRHHRGAEREIRIAEIDHDLGPRHRQGAGRHARHLERHLAVVDLPGFAAGAGHRDALAGLQRRGRRLRRRPPPARRVRGRRSPRGRCGRHGR